MITELKEFIEQNIDLIEDNDFTELYNRCRSENLGKLTDVLYECGIDPLQYMTKIPPRFAYKANITNITIPNNVKNIRHNAFSFNNRLTSITIPDSVTRIDIYAFDGCGNLQISYSGTKQEWKNLVTGGRIFIGTTYICNCSDGTVKKSR